MRHLVIIFLLACFSTNSTFAQCFSSTGNPIGGNANMGVMGKNIMRFSAFYKHSYSGKYFHGDELSVDEGHNTAEYAVYNYSSFMLGYGVSKSLTLEASTGYYINKTKAFETPMTGTGLSNAVIAAKYAFYKNLNKRFEISGKLGGKIPLKNREQRLETNTIDISKHPDVQSCLGNYGMIAQIYLIKENSFKGLRYFLISKYEHNFVSPDGYFNLRQYNFGNSLNTSVFITKHVHMPPAFSWLTENWTAILQLRHEHKWQNQIRSKMFLGYDNNNEQIYEYDDWKTVKNSGSDVFFICPQLNYTFAKKLNASLQADIPIYQHYRGIQLASNYAFSINLTYDLNFSNNDIPE